MLETQTRSFNSRVYLTNHKTATRYHGSRTTTHHHDINAGARIAPVQKLNLVAAKVSLAEFYLSLPFLTLILERRAFSFYLQRFPY